MPGIHRLAPQTPARVAETSTASASRHARPWGSEPDDRRLDELAGGGGVTPSDEQRTATRRLPDWLRRTQRVMEEACRSGLAPGHGTSIPAQEVQDMRHLLSLVPSGLLLSRFRDTAQEFGELRELDGGAICSYDQLYRLHELMGQLGTTLERAVPGGGRFQPEVLQGLASLRRWERSDHPSLPADVRQDIADRLMLAAVVDPSPDPSPVVLGGWRSGVEVDLPDALTLRRLHLPQGLVQVKLEGRSPRDWTDLRLKADAGGITLIR